MPGDSNIQMWSLDVMRNYVMVPFTRSSDEVLEALKNDPVKKRHYQHYIRTTLAPQLRKATELLLEHPSKWDLIDVSIMESVEGALLGLPIEWNQIIGGLGGSGIPFFVDFVIVYDGAWQVCTSLL